MENMPSGEMYGIELRPMFKAAPGHTLIIADYNQIEARCLLWRAGDEPTLQTIRAGKSVYQAQAETMGRSSSGHDLKKEDPKSYKYVKACLSEETLVLTDHGFKRIVDVTLRDRVWDGLAWVTHEGVVCHGERNDCVNINGEYVTPDHGIYIDRHSEQAVSAGGIPKGEHPYYLEGRISSGPGTGGDSNWALAHCIVRALAARWVAVHRVRMFRLWGYFLAHLAQCTGRADKAMPGLWRKGRVSDTGGKGMGASA